MIKKRLIMQKTANKSDATKSQKNQSGQSVRKQPSESFFQDKIKDQILKTCILIFQALLP